MKNIAIILLSNGGLETAQKIKALFPQALLYTPEKLKIKNTINYNNFSSTVKSLYENNNTLIFLCASGIIIRTLAPLLSDKFTEPPVLSISEDGKSVVPLLGANAGANQLAQKIAYNLDGYAAITTSGHIRFNINLLTPPSHLKLLNKNNAKSFISKLLNGEKVQVQGNDPWVSNSNLPFEENAKLKIHIDGSTEDISDDTLVYAQNTITTSGSVSIIGIGPGAPELMTQEAKNYLTHATDIMGYHYYIDLIRPLLTHQTVHKSDNREERARALMAFEYAKQGRHVAIISSGDPGIFAMASAVMEVWEHTKDYETVNVKICPGVSAAMSTAARIGAPLGHDFAIISLSNNLKPWPVIEKRLKAAIEADLVIALYNPVSKTRQNQIKSCFQILKENCEKNRLIIIAHDVSRPDEKIIITTLDKINTADITSRSIVLIGSSQTKSFNKNKKTWVYTPRFYP